MRRKYIIRQLSKEFYQKYDGNSYSEIERKKDRPYMVMLIRIDRNIFAIPFRTNIKHNACYRFRNSGRKTQNITGLDFSKAVIINNSKYIGKKEFVDRKEFVEIKRRYFSYLR